MGRERCMSWRRVGVLRSPKKGAFVCEGGGSVGSDEREREERGGRRWRVRVCSMMRRST